MELPRWAIGNFSLEPRPGGPPLPLQGASSYRVKTEPDWVVRLVIQAEDLHVNGG